ncbi:MAG: FtsX-like permease family protein, partial [Phycisphaerales bacterium]
IGLFGVMSCMVSRRVREIGIRRALGAQNLSLVWMVLGRASVVLLVGMAAGLAGTVATTRFLEGRLYGILPTDPATFVAVTLLLGAAALLACYFPARRATKVDPMVALRCE